MEEGLNSSYILLETALAEKDPSEKILQDKSITNNSIPNGTKKRKTSSSERPESSINQEEEKNEVPEQEIIESITESIVESPAPKRIRSEIQNKQENTSFNTPQRNTRFITILTPKKDKKTETVFLTPVKRSTRAVTNGIKNGNIKVFDNSLEVIATEPYVSLVECFKRVENISRTERRQSIDQIVNRYKGK
ncbi:hypothetical protein NEOKW01_0726 [Nematocida sp. AWRm80]|nr:hypothetical protein NEOKW01_0726 [Nematocida sp. AWRm80]